MTSQINYEAVFLISVCIIRIYLTNYNFIETLKDNLAYSVISFVELIILYVLSAFN
jgi:hypothetical protein